MEFAKVWNLTEPRNLINYQGEKMSKSTTAISATDPRMWRQLLARAHPDTGGDHELFVWTQSVLREAVKQNQPSPVTDLIEQIFSERTQRPPAPPKPRKKKPWSERRSKNHILFETDLSFDELTAQALEMAKDFDEPYDYIFSLLEGCEAPAQDEDLASDEAKTGAGYAVLADVGYALGLDGRGRGYMYNYARRIPLTQRHARYLLREVERLAAESPEVAVRTRKAAPCRGE